MMQKSSSCLFRGAIGRKDRVEGMAMRAGKDRIVTGESYLRCASANQKIEVPLCNGNAISKDQKSHWNSGGISAPKNTIPPINTLLQQLQFGDRHNPSPSPQSKNVVLYFRIHWYCGQD